MHLVHVLFDRRPEHVHESFVDCDAHSCAFVSGKPCYRLFKGRKGLSGETGSVLCVNGLVVLTRYMNRSMTLPNFTAHDASDIVWPSEKKRSPERCQ